MARIIDAVKGPINTTLTLPSSKSISQRALILAALADGVSDISGLRLNNATLTLIRALHEVGIVTQLDRTTKSCIIAGGNGKFPKKQATLWCDKAKTATYFLITAAAASAGVYYFDGAEKLRKTQFAKFLHVLCCQGVQIIPNDSNSLPFTLIGSDTLEGGTFLPEQMQNSKILSALLMLAPYARSPFSFIYPPHAQATIDMTCHLMAEFGVLVHRMHQGQLMIPTPQRYQARDYIVEIDFAIAAYFFAATAVIGGKLTVQTSKRLLSKQSDVKFLSILEKMGCFIVETSKSLTLKSTAELKGIDISLRYLADTFFALCAIAPFARTPSCISYPHAITLTESRRLAAMKALLLQMKVTIESGVDWIKIYPSTPQPQLIKQHDPRLAMALAVMGLKMPGVTISQLDYVTGHCPEFFSLWQALTQTSATLETM